MNRFHILSLSLVMTVALAGAQQLPQARSASEIRRGALAHMPRGAKTGIVHGQLLVKFAPSVAARLKAAAKNQGGKLQRSVLGSEVVPNGTFVSQIANTGWTSWRIPMVADPKGLAKTVGARDGVLYAQPVNRIYSLIADPNDWSWPVIEEDPNLIFDLTGEGNVGPYRRLWHLIDNQATAAWTHWPNRYYTAANKPVDTPTVGIIDTGADIDHPDFRNAGGVGTDVSQGGQIDKSRSRFFSLGEEAGDDVEDRNGHGTHVAGLAVAAGNSNGYTTGTGNHGTIGTGYNAKAAILRVFDDQGLGTDQDAAAAMFYAADNGVDVLNMSLGTENYSQLFQDAATYCWQKGVLVVAAGNEDGAGGGDLGPIYPAACSGVLGVSANGSDYAPATSTYSGYGRYVDIAAPGGDVQIDPLLTWYRIQFVFSTSSRDPFTSLHQNPVLFPPYDTDYCYLAGTSMAAPQVAGAAALYYGRYNLRQNQGWANRRTYRALERSALGIMGAPKGTWEYYQGYGTLDMEALISETESRGATVGGIEGIVYAGSTPLPNVAVRARRTTGGVTFSTTTAADGTYRFEALPPGTYEVRASPLGWLKVKKTIVKAGSDATGFDFWCGTYTGDETPPTVGYFRPATITASSISLDQWGYDTETGIDRFSIRVGTAPGLADVVPDTEIVTEEARVSLTGLNLEVGREYYVTGVYRNGNGDETTASSVTSIPSVRVAGNLTLQDLKAPAAGEKVTIILRTPGTLTAVETREVTLGTNGSFAFVPAAPVGAYDIAFRGRVWLRKSIKNVRTDSPAAWNMTPSLLNGDANQDNKVNSSDSSVVVKAYRTFPGHAKWNPNADLNGDLMVNSLDLAIVTKNFNKIGEP